MNWHEISLCKWDEAFTVNEMKEETGRCAVCKMDCSNAAKDGEQE